VNGCFSDDTYFGEEGRKKSSIFPSLFSKIGVVISLEWGFAQQGARIKWSGPKLTVYAPQNIIESENECSIKQPQKPIKDANIYGAHTTNQDQLAE
jgi:hypothetical protein